MATDNFKPAQLQPFSLAGAGAVVGDTSIILKSMKDIDGNVITMATAFGTIAFGTLEPGNGNLEEQISFTGITNNINGTTALTGVSSVTFLDPYTSTSGLLKTHAGSTTFVISNTSGFYNQILSKNDDATITGLYTFTQNPQKSGILIPTLAQEYATKQYVDNTATGTTTVNAELVTGIAGENITSGNILYVNTDGKWYMADSSVSSKSLAVKLGVAQATVLSGAAINVLISGLDQKQTGLTGGAVYYLSTTGSISTTKGANIRLVGRVPSGSTTTLLFEDETQSTEVQTIDNSRIYNLSTGSANAYVLTLPLAPTAYKTGQVFYFKSNFANTGSATLNVNSLGAITLKKSDGATNLVANDIASGLDVQVMYDGTNFQMLNPVSNTVTFTAGAYPVGDGSAITNIQTTKIATSTTPADSRSSNTEITLLSVSVPANTLSTNNLVKATLNINTLGAGSGTVTLRFKYGSTTLGTLVITPPNVTYDVNTCVFNLFANGATNAQKSFITVIDSVSGAAGAYYSMCSPGGTATEDSTGALNIIITAQSSVSGSNNGVLTSSYVVEKIK